MSLKTNNLCLMQFCGLRTYSSMLQAHRILLAVVIGLLWGRVCSWNSTVCGIDIRDSDTTCTIHINSKPRNTSTSNLIRLEDLTIKKSFILTDIKSDSTFLNNISSAGCFYLDRLSENQTLVFILLDGQSSLILHYSINDSIIGVERIPRLGVCNVSCNFNICKSNGSPTSYDELVAVVQNRQSICYSNNSYSIEIKESEAVVSFSSVDPFVMNYYVAMEINSYCMVITTTTAKYSTVMTKPTQILPTSMPTQILPTSIISTQTLSMFTQNLPISIPTQNVEVSPPLSSTLTVGMSASILMFVILTVILVVVLSVYIRRKATKQKQDLEHQDHQYSTYQEENTQSQSQANTNLYEQVHLSPSTEFIPSAKNESTSNIPWQSQADFQGIYSCIDTGQPKPTSQEMEEDDLKYDVVGNGNNKECKDSHDGPSALSNNKDIAATNYKASAIDVSKPKLGEDTLKEMYAVVNKKVKVEKEESAPLIPLHVIDKSCIPADQKNSNSSNDNKEVSSIPPHVAEELYTAVKRKPKENENEEVAPPIPPHTVEELYRAIMKKSKGNAKDEEQAPPIPPYTVDTAVKRDSKVKAENEEVAPPLPPRTVEELYTAVMKKHKKSAEDEEKAPPIPPYVVDKL